MTNKQFTKGDMIDAFWCGFNFREKTVITNFQNFLLRTERDLEQRELSSIAIERMFEEKLRKPKKL